MFRATAAFIAAALAASPAGAGTYSARPQAPVTDRFITRSIVWHCAGTLCQGATEASRPLVLCQSLAREAGVLLAFTADGRDFSAAELGRCNARAAGGSRTEQATAP